jgi:hypothetical protein
MMREVDRLLAGLARVGGAGPDRPPWEGRAPVQRARRFVGVASSKTAPPTRADLIALWARVLLGLGLGGVMTQWPYPTACGWPLIGYLGAVAMVSLAGGWIAFESWRLRNGPAHLLSLILCFWGIVLAAEQLLPRMGYAADRANWHCPG